MAGKKPAKVPRLFPVTIPEKRFAAAVLKRIHTVGDRDWILGLYAPQPDGSRSRPEPLAGADARRLAGLAKSIAANRGAVQLPRLVILATIAVAAVAFNLLFKNALLTRALESGLSSAFGARAEVAGLDFRLLGGSLSVDRIAVADREQPLRNLFELGATRISIDVLRLLEGRVHVRALECRDVRWDTPRERSGARAIPGSAAEEAAVEAVMEGGGGAGRSGLEKAAAGVLRAVDIPSLVDAQVAGLASTAKLEAANRRLETLTESWTANVEKGRAGIEGLSADIEKIRVFDYSKVASLKDAQALLGAVSSAAPKVKALSTSLAAAARQLSADLESAQAETASLRAALAADAASLAAKLDLSGGGWKSLASGLASRLLEKYLGRYSRWVLRGKDAVVRLAANRPGRSKGRPLARTGRTIAYPGAASPRFLLSQAAFSIAERADMPAIAATLRDVTSDPDALGRPAVLHASAARGAQALSLQASIDARSTGSSDAEVSLSAENWPLELREGLEPLSLGSLSAKAGIGMEVRLPGGGGFEGEGTVVLDSIALRPLASGDPLGDALAGALASVRKARLDFELSQPAGAGPTVSARTDLDEVLSKAAAAQGAKLAAQYEAKISAELKSRLQAELAKNEALASTLAGLEKSAAADLATAGSFQKVLADAQRSLEKKLKSAVPLPKLGF